MNAVADWVLVCSLDDIPRRGARRIDRGAAPPLALFRTAEDRLFALVDRCPHKGGPLSQGIVFGDSVACPLHNWTIALASGEACAPDHGCTPRFAVRVADRAVYVEARALAAS